MLFPIEHFGTLYGLANVSSRITNSVAASLQVVCNTMNGDLDLECNNIAVDQANEIVHIFTIQLFAPICQSNQSWYRIVFRFHN